MAIATVEVGDHPYACQLVADGTSPVGITCLGGKAGVAVDVSDPQNPHWPESAETGAIPMPFAFSNDGRVFVSCGNEDAVYAYNLDDGQSCRRN